MTHDPGELRRRERAAERRHHLAEAADGSALVGHRDPVGVRLPRREAAIGEVRQRLLEARQRGVEPPPVRPLAIRARGVVRVPIRELVEVLGEPGGHVHDGQEDGCERSREQETHRFPSHPHVRRPRAAP